jgi:hypothetical protein
MTEQRKSALAVASLWAWFIPLLPLGLAIAIYFGELQTPTFLFINRYTQILPDTLWAWLTFIGNGWGIFALFSAFSTGASITECRTIGIPDWRGN